MKEKKETKTVVVSGDVTIDWNIARIRRTEGIVQAWNANDFAGAFCQRGGEAMLADLITAVAKDLQQKRQVRVDVRQIRLPHSSIAPDDINFTHSYTMWVPFSIDGRSDKKVWRVQEFLGLSPASAVVGERDVRKKVINDSPTPDIIVVSDANLGFRESPEFWPMALVNNTAKSWILVDTDRPVAQGKLWEHLFSNHANRVIAVMTANDLRSEQVQISRYLSWERTAQDLVWEFTHNPRLQRLAKCKYVIISFGTSGAILLSQNARSEPEATLFFDPVALEGEWGRQYKGFMISYTSCLIAGITRELILNTSSPDMFRGIQSGINALRFLHIEGYGQVLGDSEKVQIAFPLDRVAAKLAEDGVCVGTTKVKNPMPEQSATTTTIAPAATNQFWTILQDKYAGSLESVAERIVLEGLESALPVVPIGIWGNLKTVDRREIEALHSISSLIREYCGRHDQTPFSIAVFGPPGAGKSFTVKEVANSVVPGEIESLTFNLSQFGGIPDLFDAFHQVRDRALSGKIPLVFWDEFDTSLQNEPLGWLRYFLSPMQDGKFQEGQIIHPIGRSIFVFAGGTSYTMETFGASLTEKEQRSVKLPDFVSRLKGFLNILGPNQYEDNIAQGGTKDPYYVIRRAILLRSMIERLAPSILRKEGNKKIAEIDRGVMRSLLLTKEYRHGARSMEALVTMSQLSGKTTFERSCLPSETQLNLHVNGLDFSALLNRMELDIDLLEKLAVLVHEIYCEDLKAQGYKYGPITREDIKEHSLLKPYADLPENVKEANRVNARDIQHKLASIGYTIVSGRGNQKPGEFSGDEIEILAEMEHERWVAQKEVDGWKYGTITDKDLKIHEDIVPWETLPETEREKDRTIVRSIPQVLARAGYIMVKLAK